ncbi:phosphatase PAP2 family protein [Desulfuromonas carbonis]|uniref:phosphatase PAP2 family protein n=1 Tax=Desulfuromonas sp. DDH964 TaxID=1823759 RepID=UPI00078CAD76|nr:phosphatase PAP2 family protein [Desulfuromonas sp. DDH964]AMV73723.1 Putative undecaprenyl-diphosphatase YbjG [Desulfuromonas sp. DDH964]
MLTETHNPFGRHLVDYCARHITSHEVLLMQRLCDLRRHRWLTQLLITASRLGDGPLWGISGLILLTVGGTAGRQAVLAAALAITASILLFKGLKNLIGRPRPCTAWADLSCLLAPPDRFSFPSGHTMTAFAACVAYGEILPVVGLLLLPVVVLVGVSRVFLGLHYPTDVLVGALLGIGLGCAAVSILAWTGNF